MVDQLGEGTARGEGWYDKEKSSWNKAVHQHLCKWALGLYINKGALPHFIDLI